MSEVRRGEGLFFVLEKTSDSWQERPRFFKLSLISVFPN